MEGWNNGVKYIVYIIIRIFRLNLPQPPNRLLCPPKQITEKSYICDKEMNKL